MLVRAQDLPFTLPNAMRLGLVAFFFNAFLPGSIGGDIVKAAFLAKEQSRRTVAVATVIIDRAVGLWGLFWLVALLGSVFWVAGDFLTPVVRFASKVTDPLVAPAWRVLDRAKARRRTRAAS